VYARVSFDIFRATRSITSNIAYCLPRNIHADQVRQMATLTPFDAAAASSSSHTSSPSPLPCELEENCMGGKVKMMTAYFGQLVNYEGTNDESEENEA
jgi:hypothetical protein